jgi:hypothetical protein
MPISRARPGHRGGVRGFRRQEGGDGIRRGASEAVGHLRLQHLDHSDHRLAKNSKRPKNFIGIHFFSPVDKMMLVEIIMGKRTGDKALAVAIDYVRAIKKTPIVVNDTRGFYVNRCVLRYMNEAYSMLIEGVPPAMIENAAKMAGMPVGPLSLTDETAIDLAEDHEADDPRPRRKGRRSAPHGADRTMVDTHGRHGRKNGKGFYDYPAKPAKKHLWPELEDALPAAGRRQHRLRGAETAPAGHHRAGSGPRDGGRHRHRPARGGCRLDPRLRLRALHGRHALLYRRHGRARKTFYGRFVEPAFGPRIAARKYGKQFKAPKLLCGNGRERRDLAIVAADLHNARTIDSVGGQYPRNGRVKRGEGRIGEARELSLPFLALPVAGRRCIPGEPVGTGKLVRVSRHLRNLPLETLADTQQAASVPPTAVADATRGFKIARKLTGAKA